MCGCPVVRSTTLVEQRCVASHQGINTFWFICASTGLLGWRWFWMILGWKLWRKWDVLHGEKLLVLHKDLFLVGLGVAWSWGGWVIMVPFNQKGRVTLPKILLCVCQLGEKLLGVLLCLWGHWQECGHLLKTSTRKSVVKRKWAWANQVDRSFRLSKTWGQDHDMLEISNSHLWHPKENPNRVALSIPILYQAVFWWLPVIY